MDGAVVDDRQQRPAAVGLQRLGEEQPQGDGVDPGRAVGAHGEGGLDPQPGGVQVVAGQEAPGVEGDAGGQAGTNSSVGVGPWSSRRRMSAGRR